MVRNLGNTDRLIRIILGTGLVFWGFATSGGGVACLGTIIGLVLLTTGMAGRCPLCGWLNLDTCRIPNPRKG
ncbi:MAG: DUF2892 domain-containing protein [Nitrospinaceae bacterium]